MATSAQRKSKPKAVLRHQCGSCNEIFTGKTCPNCGEEINIFRVNADGLAIDDVASAVGATNSLPIRLAASPVYDPIGDVDEILNQQFKDVVRDGNLDKVKALAAEQKAKRLRAEQELAATEKGFMPPEQGTTQQEQNDMSSMGSAVFIQALGGWDPDQRAEFLDRLASDPMLALNLSTIMNPGKAGGMSPMGMMNPMGMMGQMMQPQQEPVPQVDAATMVTAMIAGMQSLKEMSGGDGGDSKQIERLLDKMDEMRKETEELKLKIVEEQNKPSESLSSEDIRRIVVESMSNATAGKVGLLNGLQEIHAVADELTELGIVQKPRSETDPAQILEERKFTHQMKMDDREAEREYELALQAKEAEIANAQAKESLISGILAGAMANQTPHIDEADTNTQPIKESVKAEPGSAVVIS